MQTQYWINTSEWNRLSTQASHRIAVERVIRYIRENIHEPLSLESLADIACLSPYYFNRVFHSLIGLPPGEFLTSLRLEAAKRLLLTTQLSVTDICFAVGYSGLGSFTTRFSQQIGVSPRLLRSLAQERVALVEDPDLVRTTIPLNQLHSAVSYGSSLSGSIAVPCSFRGLIFAGLFLKPIPQGRPVRCTRMTTPGIYHISNIPNGRYYLMVAAFPLSEDPQTYLLPDSSVLVGSYGPVEVYRGVSRMNADVLLHPLSPTDPPLLSALPFL